MANRLELPDDLQKLVEKREQAERREGGASTPGQGDAGVAQAEPRGDDPHGKRNPERRSGADRRAEE